MRSVTIVLLAATCALAASPLDLVEDLIAAPSSVRESSSLPPPPVKLDKSLRRALLKALVDLEAESAEQHQSEAATTSAGDKDAELEDAKYDFLEISRQKSASFSFDGFPAEDDSPSEDKLQNSSFVEAEKLQFSDADQQPQAHKLDQTPPKDYTKGVQVHEVVGREKDSAIYEPKPAEQLESVESRNVASTSSSSLIQKSVTFAPITETLSVSASGSVAAAAANSLTVPRPTASPPNASTQQQQQQQKASGASKSSSTSIKKQQQQQQQQQKEGKAEEVKIYQAPLVAAFTVQQDERGVPKSVVPLYRSSNGSLSSQPQPLSLQEQLEFKQRLLEKQLQQLQAQQAQQTQFLLRQRQAYEQQFRIKQQQHDFYLQEQRRLQQQFPPPPQPQFFLQPQQQQQLPQLQQQQQPPQQQQQQQFKATSVQFQPSLQLEVPSIGPAPVFQRPLVPQQQQQQQHFPAQPFEFQQPPAVAPLGRFNRQEAFGSVGNFGFNSFNAEPKNRLNQFGPNSFAFNQFRPQQQQQQQQQQHRQFGPQQTPARQIQDLLYQSGIAGDLQGAGTRNQDDLNIVSKVLALNVGALPPGLRNAGPFQQQQQQQQQQFGGLNK